MPLLSQKEVSNLKLSSIPLPQLRELALKVGLDRRGSAAELIKRLSEREIDQRNVGGFIKEKFEERIWKRRAIISDKDLLSELMKVKTFSWGVVQGQLDQKIQVEYVRRFARYDELLSNVKATLYDEVTNYVICTWFNHWTTVLIEEHISSHPKVIPTLKDVKGFDIFFDAQPFDLKVTYLPRDYDPISAVENPKDLAVWMYENQGAQRFGADNRLFVVLLDKDNPEKSWELKRDFDLVFQKIDNFFDKQTVSREDEIVFTFNRNTYTTVTKALIITK